MQNLTDIFVTSSYFKESGATCRQQIETGELRTIEKSNKATFFTTPNEIPTSAAQSQRKTLETPISVPWAPTGADSIPLQIWEGTVLNLDREANTMHVMLNAKMGHVARHSADIDLEWVSDQDEDLVRPGAVFYLTLFKRTKRGSIENSQELRFRRRPSWSPTQLKRIEDDSSALLAKMKALPLAE